LGDFERVIVTRAGVCCPAATQQTHPRHGLVAFAREPREGNDRSAPAGCDPLAVIGNTRQVLNQAKSPAEIILGSIHSDGDIVDSHIAGAHIVTAEAEYFKKMTAHPHHASIDGS
jgi:hypothetical protein